MRESVKIRMADRLVVIDFGEPFTVCGPVDQELGKPYLIHPKLYHHSDGSLILTVNQDRDVFDPEYMVFRSTDKGLKWEPVSNWPTSDGFGNHLATLHAVLPDGSSLVVYNQLFTTDEKDVFILPSWRSCDGGKTWSGLQASRVKLPFGASMDFYNPPDWWIAEHGEEWIARFVKPEPPPALRPLTDKFGSNRLSGQVTQLLPLDHEMLLAFVYLAPEKGVRYITVCLESHDAGRSWSLRSIPGPVGESLEKKNLLKKNIDGMCEPSVARMENGNLLCIMRLGSRQPLQIAISPDNGLTWTQPRSISVDGILPTVIPLESGLLALASGRPDITFSLSLGDPAFWPWTFKLFEDEAMKSSSTKNNTMIEVEPGRLLYLYDYGYHTRPEGIDLPRKIEGRYITVSIVDRTQPLR